MQTYVDCLNENGILFFSGFYTEDFEAINASCVSKGLTFEKDIIRNNWMSLKYNKNS